MQSTTVRRTIKNVRGKLITQYKKQCLGCGVEFWANRLHAKYCVNVCGRTVRDPIEIYFREKITRTKQNSKPRQIKFDLTWEQLKTLHNKQKGLCYYTNVPLVLTFAANPERVQLYNQLSIDRVDSNKGYEIDNIVLCCLSINMMKNDFPMEDLKNMFKAIHDKQIQNLTVRVKSNQLFNTKINNNTLENTGSDLYCNSVEDCGTFIKVHTGVSVQPPKGYYFDLVPRSSTFKKGLLLYNSVGIIDQSYTGEIIAIFKKTQDFIELPNIGDRLCQLILRQVILVDFVEEDFEITEREKSGFGSSGN
jgi:deoxyuridine 5'-triphosphate nucleotidohydrolase